MSRWLQPEFEKTFPLSFLMRQRHPQWWLRIHSLPDSKRYPGNEGEREIVFQRHAAFGTALLGPEAPCLFVRSRGAPERGSEFDRALSWTPLPTIADDGENWSSWMTEMRWTPERLRHLLLDVAEERDGRVLFISKNTDAVFAPYDGGADGFSFDVEVIARLRREFAPWLSSHPGGL